MRSFAQCPAARRAFFVAQAAIIILCLLFSMLVIRSPAAGRRVDGDVAASADLAGSAVPMDVEVQNEKRPTQESTVECPSTGRSLFILPFAFLTGGLMNMEGFSTVSVLML
eukprot:TRINITY_DN21177_c2_g1_i1.p2 TRINITY_DN21177_c2_g1~~TRINITY_DN21177_c2_g1_i1.p2  ORF type:complete len:111 (-),score=16.52 TRINITY_DN21177_c2_g1_i1:59-391(-)